MHKHSVNKVSIPNEELLKWFVGYDSMAFGYPNNFETHGWFGDYSKDISDKGTFSKRHKIWLYLMTCYAYKPDQPPQNNNIIRKLEEPLKGYFIQHYWKDAKKVILFFDLILASNNINYCPFCEVPIPVKPIPNHPPAHHFLTSKIWEKYHIFSRKQFKDNFDIILCELWRKICLEERRALIDIFKFEDAVSKISELTTYFADILTPKPTPLTIEKLKLLNNYRISLACNDTSCLHSYLFALCDNLVSELEQRKIVSLCKRCGCAMLLKKGKKYCSLKSENRDCGKMARNKIFYLQNRESILLKARKSNQELRAFYKAKGIKK